MPKVSKRAVDALGPGATTRFLRDDQVIGFAVRVTPAGVRSYILEYRYGGRPRRMTIGRHGAPWTPKTARDEAVRLRAELAAGRDPARRDVGSTFAELAERYMIEHALPKKKPSSAQDDRGALDRHILPPPRSTEGRRRN